MHWLGPKPEKCDTCDTPISTTFYDGQTVYGRWAHMCPSCFHLGPGLGQLGKGRGQEYKLVDQQYKKTAG